MKRLNADAELDKAILCEAVSRNFQARQSAMILGFHTTGMSSVISCVLWHLPLESDRFWNERTPSVRKMRSCLAPRRGSDVPPGTEPILKLELGLSQRQPASFAEA